MASGSTVGSCSFACSCSCPSLAATSQSEPQRTSSCRVSLAAGNTEGLEQSARSALTVCFNPSSSESLSQAMATHSSAEGTSGPSCAAVCSRHSSTETLSTSSSAAGSSSCMGCSKSLSQRGPCLPLPFERQTPQQCVLCHVLAKPQSP